MTNFNQLSTIQRELSEVLTSVGYYSKRRTHLDNYTTPPYSMPSQGDDSEMAYKINRPVTIDGAKLWIRANSEQEYADKLMKRAAAENPPTARCNFKEYAQKWFDIYSKPNIAQATAVTYERQLRLHLYPFFGDMSLDKITVDDAQRFFNQLDGAKATKTKARMVLNMVLDAAVEDKIIPRNPAKSSRVKIVGADTRYTEPYSVEEMRYLVEHIKDIKKDSDRAYLAIHTMTPLRLEEVLGLQWKDVDFESGLLSISRAVTHPDRNKAVIKDTKTTASERVIALSSTTLEVLRSIPHDNPTDFVVGGSKPHCYSAVRRMCERIQRDTGFDGKITSMRFRPTVISDLYNTTKDLKFVQKASGHAQVDTTLKHYITSRETPENGAAALERVYAS